MQPNIQQRGRPVSGSISRNPYQEPPTEQGLPHLPPSSQPAALPTWVSQGTSSLPQPPSAGLRSRPLSAGMRRTQTEAPPVIRGIQLFVNLQKYPNRYLLKKWHPYVCHVHRRLVHTNKC